MFEKTKTSEKEAWNGPSLKTLLVNFFKFDSLSPVLFESVKAQIRTRKIAFAEYTNH